MTWRNPVLAGFHPDPSACRVGEWFYLATSSFQFFPGLPLRRSTDLVHWELVGHAIDRPGQLDLRGTAPSRGLFAPTLRHHEGRLYLTCTEVDRLGNFLVSAPSIEGPWSEPLPIAVDGIDPSLFFDRDGTAYLCSNGRVDGRQGIALSVIDPANGAILEGPRHVCAGSGGRWPEGPHLYRRGDAWYLLLSEGGTEYGHFVTVFRAPSPWGPYEACPRNPVLTHRDDAMNPIQCVGHADFVEDAEGHWWCLCLGTRPLGPLLHNLGRETFLAPVSWDDGGWPVIGEGGRLAMEMDGPLPGARSRHEKAPTGPAAGSWSMEATDHRLALEWVSPRSRDARALRFHGGRGLLLRGSGCALSEPGGAPALVARPQTSVLCTFEASLEIAPGEGRTEAGIVVYYDEDYHYAIVVRTGEEGLSASLRRRVHDLEVEGPSIRLPSGGCLRLRIEADAESYGFLVSPGGSREAAWLELGAGLCAGLCSEGTWRMSFTGVHFGLYCREGDALFTKASCVDGEAHGLLS
jgi:alpha-N-arabinofuranosidase